jgi:hypothetical protein
MFDPMSVHVAGGAGGGAWRMTRRPASDAPGSNLSAMAVAVLPAFRSPLAQHTSYLDARRMLKCMAARGWGDGPPIRVRATVKIWQRWWCWPSPTWGIDAGPEALLAVTGATPPALALSDAGMLAAGKRCDLALWGNPHAITRSAATTSV